MNTGVLGAIELLGKANTGKSDRETQELVRQIIVAIESKIRRAWPSKELRTHYNLMDKLQQRLFLQTLKDMDEAIAEAYGDV